MTVRIVIVFLLLLLLYLLAIMPRVRAGASRTPFRSVPYAHRGLHDSGAGVPENSLAAFRRAADAGCGIELDVQNTRDGVPVVFHDFTLARMARYADAAAGTETAVSGESETAVGSEAEKEGGGPAADGSVLDAQGADGGENAREKGRGVPGKISDYTWKELQAFRLQDSDEQIPRLADVLSLVDGRVPLLIELKIERFDLSVCAGVMKLLKEYNGLWCMESFHPLGVRWFKKHERTVLRGQLSDNFRKDPQEGLPGLFTGILTYMLLNFLGRPDFISYNYRYTDNLSFRLCRKWFHAMTAVWTVQDPETYAACREVFDMIIFEGFMPEEAVARNL